MSSLRPLGFSIPTLTRNQSTTPEQIIPHKELHQVLEFTRHTIDDIVNNDLAKREVLGYYKLRLDVQRRCEATDLERWWTSKQA